jgi:hypothetical protein
MNERNEFITHMIQTCRLNHAKLKLNLCYCNVVEMGKSYAEAKLGVQPG